MVDTENPQTEEDWLACLNLPQWAQVIPAGHLMPLGSPEIWVDGNGDWLTTEQYEKTHGVKPAVIWAAKKKYLAQHGPGVKFGKDVET